MNSKHELIQKFCDNLVVEYFQDRPFSNITLKKRINQVVKSRLILNDADLTLYIDGSYYHMVVYGRGNLNKSVPARVLLYHNCKLSKRADEHSLRMYTSWLAVHYDAITLEQFLYIHINEIDEKDLEKQLFEIL